MGTVWTKRTLQTSCGPVTTQCSASVLLQGQAVRQSGRSQCDVSAIELTVRSALPCFDAGGNKHQDQNKYHDPQHFATFVFFFPSGLNEGWMLRRLYPSEVPNQIYQFFRTTRPLAQNAYDSALLNAIEMYNEGTSGMCRANSEFD